MLGGTCAEAHFGHAQLTKLFPAQRRHTLALMDHEEMCSIEKLGVTCIIEIPFIELYPSVVYMYSHPNVCNESLV